MGKMESVDQGGERPEAQINLKDCFARVANGEMAGYAVVYPDNKPTNEAIMIGLTYAFEEITDRNPYGDPAHSEDPESLAMFQRPGVKYLPITGAAAENELWGKNDVMKTFVGGVAQLLEVSLDDGKKDGRK